MALITCKSCGKSISDKAERCIHCGQPLTESVTPPVEPPKKKNADLSHLPKYNDMSNVKRTELEKEFLETDKWAYNYRRKGLEIQKLGKFAFWIPVALGAVAVLINYITENIHHGFVMMPALETAGIVFFVIAASTFPLSFCLLIYNRFSFNNKTNRLTYHKKLQAWLLRVKKINYQPAIFTEKEKNLFNEIDIEEDFKDGDN